MAVYELNNGRMLRVARSIDGKLRQQYFTLIDLNKTQQRKAWREAKALDEQWRELQERARDKRVREARTDEGHSTGVRGINLVRRPSPAFRVQVQTNGTSNVREFSITRLGEDKAWRQATQYLARCRGYRSVPKAWTNRPAG
ncbi:MAG: hypothetical protein R3E86_21700 [Pseudomonadales bacterium]